MPSFGKASRARLATLRADMRATANDGIEILDFSVIQTVRGQAEQDRYFASGASSLEWPYSKHNIFDERPEAEAMDLWPYVPPFGALSGHPDQVASIAAQTGRSTGEVQDFIYKAFARLAGVIEACGHKRGIRIRWGGDWDRDGNLLDQTFHDLPHFEYVETLPSDEE